MYYNFELVMAGAILLTAMLIGGIALRIKRNREDANPIDDASVLQPFENKTTWPTDDDERNTDAHSQT